MERNLKLVVAYDGTGFHGWQCQAGQRTVQAELEAVLRRVVRHPATVIGASRTDAGVHARGQVAHLRTDCPMPAENLRRAIGDRLPADIALVDVREVSPAFDARRGARGKLYRYGIHNTRHRPVEELATRYFWHVWRPLDVESMRVAASLLCGCHDFAGFMNLGSPRDNTVRSVYRLEIRRRYEQVWVDVEGDGFLYNQVRIMVGTLVEVGRGHWPPQRMAEILALKDRRLAGPTAPPHGLCLQWVRYEPQWSVASGA